MSQHSVRSSTALSPKLNPMIAASVAALVASQTAWAQNIPQNAGVGKDSGRYVSLLAGPVVDAGGTFTSAEFPGETRDGDFATGYLLGARLGYDFGSVFQPEASWDDFTFNPRAELEYSWLKQDVSAVDPAPSYINSGTFESHSVFANGYIDLDLPGPGTIYAGAGVGFSWLSLSTGWGSGSDTGFGWQARVGYEHGIAGGTSLYGGVMYRDYFDSFSATGIGLDDFDSVALEFGIRHSF